MFYDKEEALNYFNIEAKNNFSYGFKINYSKCLMDCGRLLESLHILQGLEKKYNSWDLKYLIGKNYLLNNNYKSACEFLEDSLLENSIYPNTHLNLARCYEKLGNKDKLILSLKKYKYFR